MKVIGALFDDGNCSYKKAIEQYFNGKYEVYSIGINEPPFVDTQYYKYRKIDLSIFNTNLIKELEKLPGPDIILASPPCESWSIADTIKTYQNESIKLNNKLHYDNENKKFLDANYKAMYRNFYKKQLTRIIGESTIMGTIQIIEYFKPNKGVIENPMSSKTGLYQKEFLNFYGFENKTYYNNYDNYPFKKPTIFKSNIGLNLKYENIKSKAEWKNSGCYDSRSIIPNSLIKDIISQLDMVI